MLVCASSGNCPRKKYVVQIGTDKSEWVIKVHPNGDKEDHTNNVAISLKLVSENENKTYKVASSFGIKTTYGYWPQDFLELSKDKENFDKFTYGDSWGYTLCSREEFSAQFVGNKIILEGYLVFSMTAMILKKYHPLTLTVISQSSVKEKGSPVTKSCC